MRFNRDKTEINWAAVRDSLAGQAEAIAEKYLPGGKWGNKSSYSCGDINGGAGASFNFALKDKGWRFTDFSTDEQGDIIDLIIHHEGSERDGRRVALEMTGQQDPLTKREYKMPKADYKNAVGPMLKFYFHNRGLTDEAIINELPIGQKDNSIAYLHNKKESCKFVVYKDMSKQRPPYCSSDAEPILWGMDTKLEGNQLTEEEIVITEGHEDAVAWMHAGCRAVSIPMGANNIAWISNSWEFINKFKRIYLSFDSDDAGSHLIKLASERIGLGKCLIVNHGGCKDGNDLWKKSGASGMAKALSGAKELKPDNVVRGSDLVSRIKDNWDKPRQDYGVPLMGDYEYGLNLREAETTIVTGEPGSGKSNFLYQAAAHLISIGHPVFIFSLEESAEVVTSLVYSHCMAQPCTVDHEVHFNHVVQATSELLHVYDLRGQLTVDKMHEAVNYAVGRHDVKFVVLDSIMMLKNCNIEDNEAMNDFMGDVQELVTSTRIHLLAVAHSRKGDYSSVSKIPGRDEIKGSGSIGAMAFNVFTIWRNLGKVKKLAEVMKSGDMENYYSIEKHFSDNIFNLCKQKVGGNLCMKDMFYNPTNSRFRLRWQDQDEPYILSPSQLKAIELEKQILANNAKLNHQQPF